MVIKVDFNLTMTLLTYNIYKLMAMDLDRYQKIAPQTVYEMFMANSADIEIKDEEIIVALKKKGTCLWFCKKWPVSTIWLEIGWDKKN
jgi:hypothetical protein